MQKRSRNTFGFRLVSIVLLLSLLVFPILSGTAPFGEKASAAYEDWQTQNFYQRLLKDIDAVGTSIAWAVGDEGTILKTTDAGATWVLQESGSYLQLCAVSASDASVVWAVGNNPYWSPDPSVILHTVDGGEAWATQLSIEECQLLDVYAVNDMDAWAVGENGTVLTTSDGGATWASRDCGTTTTLNAVFATSAGTAWVVGEGGTILKTGDNGLTWEAPASGTTRELNSIHSLDGSVLWAVGASGTVLKGSNGGSTWTAKNLASEGNLNDVCVVDDQIIWAVGDPADFFSRDEDDWYGRIYKSFNGGESWWPMGEIFYEGLGMAAPDADNAWVVGGDIDILKTSDGGYTWVDQLPATLSALSGIGVVDAYTAFAARGAGDVLKTTDGGATWTSTDTGPDDWYSGLVDIAAVDSNNVWVVGRDGTIFRTDDGGGMLLLQIPETPEYLLTVAAVDNEVAWVGGSSGTILKTGDGGETWVYQDTEPALDVIVDISAVSANVAWAVGHDSDTNYATMLKTVNGGEDWSIQDIGASYPVSIASVCAVDENVVWAAGPYFLLRSTDGGESWEFTENGYPIYWFSDLLNVCIFAIDECTAWVVGGRYDDPDIGTIFKTTDGGASWHEQYECGHAPCFVGAVDCCNAWVVGRAGMIVHTSNGGDDWPDLLSPSPASGGSGAEVTISGCDFGDTRDSSTIFFGDTPAQDYVSWSNDQVVVRVPELAPGETKITVATSAGTSNWKNFTVEPLSLQAVVPAQTMQHTISLNLELSGSGFQPGATVELRRGDMTLSAYNVQVVSDTRITCTCGFFGAEAGAYDVAVTSPGGGETVLAEGFTVTPICGTGSGAAVLMLGLSLGLLSATFSLRRRRRKT